VAAIIAPTFARIFYRNAFNMGLPIFELPECMEIKEGESVSVDMDAGTITNITNGKVYNFIPIPPFMQELIAAGGLMNFAADEIAKQGN
jgi:3-isopropylmalate/(R)-2-methylmalate dehydratase small subunit